MTVSIRDSVVALTAALAGGAALGAPAGAATFQPEDFRYLGAFRFPSESWMVQGSQTDQFAWCKGIEAYYPGGDPSGPADGFPGSLYGVGHEWTTPMYEIAIPAPVIADDVGDLPVAGILQHPTLILEGVGYDEDLLKGIEYLPAMAGMTQPKLHISFGKHYQYNRRPTHGWLNLDLAGPQTAGPWFVGSASQVSDLNTNEYVFTIPADWAAAHAGGKRLACGRHREGQEATGPSIIAYAPWESGNPPPAQAQLAAKPLVLYRDLNLVDGLDEHCWADNWTGGAWLRSQQKMSVAIIGTKGYGDCWYGWQDGTTQTECESWPGGCEANGYGGSNRGFYASSFRTIVLLYDPDDLARVAHGTLTSWDIQPYLRMDITPYMIQPESTYEIQTGGVAYDEEHGYLYITERYADRTRMKPVIHVFAVRSERSLGDVQQDATPRSVHDGPSAAAPVPASLEVSIAMDRRSDVAAIRLAGPVASSPRRVTVHDIAGRLVDDLGASTSNSFEWSTRGVADGVYFVRVRAGADVATRKVVVVH